jgi:hypothetical protein
MRLPNHTVLAAVFAFWVCATACSAPAPPGGAATPAGGAHTWTEGVNYFLINPVRPTSLPPGKVEVTEVFSYACPACNIFVPTMHKLKASLPPNAVLDYLPASFNPSEDWPMFQLAYLTAQTLGVADQTHDAMFNAVWQSGELAVIDPATRGLKSPLPTIEDAAKFYKAKAGVPVDKFLETAKRGQQGAGHGGAAAEISRRSHADTRCERQVPPEHGIRWRRRRIGRAGEMVGGEREQVARRPYTAGAARENFSMA